MNRFLRLVPTLIILALTACGSGNSPSVTYTAPGAFSFTIPAGFTSVNQTGESFPIFVDQPTEYTAYMQIATDDYQGDLQQFVDTEMQGFKDSSQLSKVTVTSSSDFTTKSGVQGIRALLTFSSQKGQMEMAAYYFQKPGQVEVLHGICYAQEASKYIPLFDDSANSVVLK